MRKMAEGIVPLKEAEAAEIVLNGLDETLPIYAVVSAYLQSRIDAPHFLPMADPWVHVRFEYGGYRQGNFDSEALIPLSLYLGVRVKGGHFSWSDVLGKHSELDCTDDDFDATIVWVDDVNEFEMHGQDCADQWREALAREDSDDDSSEKEITGFIKQAVADHLKEKGPFLPNAPEITWANELKVIKKRVSRAKKSSKKQKTGE